LFFKKSCAASTLRSSPPAARRQIEEHHDQPVVAQILGLGHHHGLVAAHAEPAASPLIIASFNGVALSTLSKSNVESIAVLPFSNTLKSLA